jgi:anti-sigma factor RsiW
MSVHPVDDDHLLAYVGNQLDAAAAAVVGAHLSGCADCAATVGRLRLVADTVRADAAAVPPPQVIARAKALFAPNRLRLARDLVGPLRRIVAQLTFDSRGGQAAALAGFRGGTASYQLAFAGAGAEVDLQLEPPLEPGSGWQLLGQVATDEAPAPIVVEIVAAGEDAVVARTTTDEHGVFNFAAPAGRYDFVVTLPDLMLVLPNLDVG